MVDGIGNQIKGQFSVGEPVWFITKRDGKIIHGQVCKINRKNIQIREDDRNWMVWNVSPSLLNKGTLDSELPKESK